VLHEIQLKGFFFKWKRELHEERVREREKKMKLNKCILHDAENEFKKD
jgi:hypothetical protein